MNKRTAIVIFAVTLVALIGSPLEGQAQRHHRIGSLVITTGFSCNYGAYREHDIRLLILSWIVVGVGTVTSLARPVIDLFAERTRIDFYEGQSLQGQVEVGRLLENVEMESLEAAAHPDLVDSLVMADVLRQLNLDPNRVSRLIVSAKSWADGLLGKEIGDDLVVLTSQTFNNRLGSLTDTQNLLARNYLRLRNIVIK